MILKDMMSQEVPLLKKGNTIETAVRLFRHSKIDVLPEPTFLTPSCKRHPWKMQ